jgi:M6 family metalloprotease-like protein
MRFAPIFTASLIGLSTAAAVPPGLLAAQDVEALGERYGTLPPAGYFEQLAADPDAFRFARGKTGRVRACMDAEAALDPGALRVLGPRYGPVLGVFRFPVVPGLFSDSPESISVGRDVIQAAYFGGGPGTITDFYDELSGGRVEIIGDVIDWTRAAFTRAQATGGESGLEGTTGAFITKLLERSNDVDWGLYDNDGPDGLANSGDDDGYVDVLPVIQPTAGAECGGADKDHRIWSHRWYLSAHGSAFTSTVPVAGGGFIRIDDYFIQPVSDCSEQDLNPIGVISHELAHAFGLPDLYDTDPSDGKHAGAGNWDLMSTGSFGCDWGPKGPGVINGSIVSPGQPRGSSTRSGGRRHPRLYRIRRYPDLWVAGVEHRGSPSGRAGEPLRVMDSVRDRGGRSRSRDSDLNCVARDRSGQPARASDRSLGSARALIFSACSPTPL